MGRLSHPPSSSGHEEYVRLSRTSVTFTEPPCAATSRESGSRVSDPLKLRLDGEAVSESEAPRTLIVTEVVAAPVSPAASVAVTWKRYVVPLLPVKLADVRFVRESQGWSGPPFMRYGHIVVVDGGTRGRRPGDREGRLGAYCTVWWADSCGRTEVGHKGIRADWPIGKTGKPERARARLNPEVVGLAVGRRAGIGRNRGWRSRRC